MRQELQAFVPYAAQDVFDLVADVGSYAEFVPWCARSRVYDRYARGFTAQLWGPMGKSFVSQVHLDYPCIRIDYIEGVFQSLQHHWRFASETDGTRLEFFIDFQLKNSYIHRLMRFHMTMIVRRMMQAFMCRFQEKLPPISQETSRLLDS